jgi:hypothetical protein
LHRHVLSGRSRFFSASRSPGVPAMRNVPIIDGTGEKGEGCGSQQQGGAQREPGGTVPRQGEGEKPGRPGNGGPQVVEKMVGMTGFEPATPWSRKRRLLHVVCGLCAFPEKTPSSSQ